MIQCCGSLRFNLETLSLFFTRGNTMWKKFYSDFSIQLGVQSFVDDTSRKRDKFIVFFTEGRHATLTDFFEDFIM
jgi:hypothetical protein